MRSFTPFFILFIALPLCAQEPAGRLIPFDDIVYVQAPGDSPDKRNNDTVRGVPVIGNVPIIGSLFQRDLQLPQPPKSSAEVQRVIETVIPPGRETLALDLDSVLLANAARSLAEGDERTLLSKLKSIQIRGFVIEASTPEAYRSKVQPIRDVLKSPEWVRYASHTAGQSQMEIWSARWGNAPTGVLLLSITEGKQVFIMNVAGELRPDQLLSLSGKLGIPNFVLPLGQR